MKLSPNEAKKILEMRRKKAAISAKPAALTPLDPSFVSQNNFILDPARFIAAQCSRRAGKSNGLAIRFKNTLDRYPGAQCIYLALTRDSARDIMWPILQELNEKHKWGCEFIESKLWMVNPNGAVLKLMGADMKNFIKRIKGRKSPGIAIDEAQDFGSHLQSLIDDVLTPMLADYSDGWLAVTGTPGPVPAGYFFEVTQKGMYGFSLHKWTLYENPYMPNPEEFVADLKRKRAWDDKHPTLRREWLNEWVLDVEALWIRYKEEYNDYAVLPRGPLHFVLGIDVGYKDADALAVLAWTEDSPVTYLVEEVITRKQGLTELADQIRNLMSRYTIDKMVIDEGGLGKKLAEELRRRFGIPVQPADKLRKQENVEFLNDALRRSMFRAKSQSRFAKDSFLVQIDWDRSTPDRIVIKKHPHSDIIDAVLYAFKESPAYTYQQPAMMPAYGTPEWGKHEETRMFDEAMDHFQKQAEQERAFDPDRDWDNS